MSTVLHAIFGYIFLLLIVRVLSRRPEAQLTPFEFVIVILIGGILILSTVGHDRSVTNCACAILAVGMMHRLFSTIKIRSLKFARLIDGTPIILYRNGEFQMEAMKGMKIGKEDIVMAARAHGLRNLDNVEAAILERDGGISVLAYRKQQG